LPSAYDATFPYPCTYVHPGQPFRTCQIYGPCEPSRDDRGRGAVGLPRRKSHVSKMPPACLRCHFDMKMSVMEVFIQQKFTWKFSRFMSDDSDICQSPKDCCCQICFFIAHI
jgi:hypothetical protein